MEAVALGNGWFRARIPRIERMPVNYTDEAAWIR